MLRVSKMFGICLLVNGLLAGCASVAQSADWEQQADTLMVVIDDPRSDRRQRGAPGPGYSARLAYQEDPLLRRASAKIASDYGLKVVQQWPLDSLGVHCFVVVVPSSDTVQALVADSRVKWVQPFNEFTTQTATPLAVGEPAPSIPGVAGFQADIGERGKGVKIAVIDTSIDKSHPDFRQSQLSEHNFAGLRGQPAQENHGTAVVGLIAAKSDNIKGVNGLAQEADVEVLRACWQAPDGSGKCNTLTLALALDAAVAMQPDIVNLSLTGKADRVLQELVDLLLAQGSLVVAAYDEKRSFTERFPEPRAGVVYAFGTDNIALPAHSSEAVLVAPRQALSLAPRAGYGLVSGHSIAAPQIAAVAACLIERFPGADRPQILDYLREWLGGS